MIALVIALSILVVTVVAATPTSFMYVYAQGFDELINESGASRLQQDLDNEQAFMDCLETTPANECWAQVLEDCTKLLTIEECEAIESEGE